MELRVWIYCLFACINVVAGKSLFYLFTYLSFPVIIQ